MTADDYNRCVDQQADAVYRFILGNIKDLDNAKDIVQEAFEKLWLKHPEVAAEKSKSYLFSTAYHCMIDHIRKAKRMVSMDDNIHYEPSYSLPQSDLQSVLHDALGRLPETQRSVIMLRDYEGYSYEEIGEMTGLNESQVKVYIYRGRQFLKNYIGTLENVL